MTAADESVLEPTALLDGKRSTTAPVPVRTAVVVVHGVGNPQRGDTVRTIATSWADMRRRSLAEPTLRLAVEPVADAARDALPSGWVDREYLKAAEIPAVVTEVATVETRSPARGDAHVDFVELYWGDLSRTGRGALDVGLDLVRLILYLPDLGARILAWRTTEAALGAEVRGARRFALRMHRLAWFLFANVTPALFALALLTCGVLTATAWAPPRGDAIVMATPIAVASLVAFATWLGLSRLCFRHTSALDRVPTVIRSALPLVGATLIGVPVYVYGAFECTTRIAFTIDAFALFCVLVGLAHRFVMLPLCDAKNRARGFDAYVDKVFLVAAVVVFITCCWIAAASSFDVPRSALTEIATDPRAKWCAPDAFTEAALIARPVLACVWLLAGALVVVWMLKIAFQALAALAFVCAPFSDKRAIGLAAASLAISSWLFVSFSLALTFALFSATRSVLDGLIVLPIGGWLSPEDPLIRPLSELVEKSITFTASWQLRNGAVVAGTALVIALCAFAPVAAVEWRGRPRVLSRMLGVGRNAAELQRRWLAQAFAILWLPLLLIVIDTTFINALGLVDSIISRFVGDNVFLVWARLGEHEVESWVTFLGAAFVGGSGLLALRARLENFLPNLGPVVDICLDVERYVRRPAPRGLRAAALTRMLALLDTIEARGYDRIVIAAHSQGSVIAADALRLRVALGRRSTVPIALLTFGSPLRSLYAPAFTGAYSWVETLGSLEPLALASWTNAYHDGDYVGRSIAHPSIIDVDLGVGGHLGYWDDSRLIRRLDELVVRGRLTEHAQHRLMEEAGMGAYKNWAGTVAFDSRVTITPDLTATTLSAKITSIATRVGDAVRARRHVRAKGSLWSFSDIVVGTDALVDLDNVADAVLTRPANLMTAPLNPLEQALGKLKPPYDKSAFALVGAGVKVYALLDALGAAQPRLSPITLGSASGQSIAGVISTGSHGGDFDRPPVADVLAAVVLIGADGRVKWIEPDDERRITSDEPAVKAALPAVEDVLYDTSLFNAALVTVGALGPIVAYVARVLPAYSLREDVTRKPWSEVKEVIRDGGTAFTQSPPWTTVGPGERHRYVEVLVNPYRTSDDYSTGGDRDRDTIVVFRSEKDGAGAPWTRPPSGPDLFRVLATLELGNLRAFRGAVTAIQESGRSGTSGAFYDARCVMDTGRTSDDKVWSYDAVIPVTGDKHIQFIDALLARWDTRFAQGQKFAGFFTLRFTRTSSSLLATHDPGTNPDALLCHLECSALERLRNLTDIWDPTGVAVDGAGFLQDLLATADSSPDARFNFGQMGRWDVRNYPRIARWDAEVATAGVGLAFTNDFLVRHGVLAPGADYICVGGAVPSRASNAPLDARHAARASPCVVDGWLYASEGDGWVGRAHFAQATSLENLEWELLVHRNQSTGIDDHAPTPQQAVSGPICAARNADGHHEVFARFFDGCIYHRWELNPNAAHPSGWQPWTQMDSDQFASSPSVAIDGKGHLVVVAVHIDGALRWRRQNPTGWTSWSVVPNTTGCVGRPTLLRLADGTIEVYVRQANNMTTARIVTDANGWSAITQIVAAASDAGVAHLDAPAPRSVLSVMGPTGKDLLVVVRDGTAPYVQLANVALQSAPIGDAAPATALRADGAIDVFVVRDSAIDIVRLPMGGPAKVTSENVVLTSSAAACSVGSSSVVVFAKAAHDVVVGKIVT
jgi:hypothetical protein